MGNAQSPHQDLAGTVAINKVKEIAEAARTCFFSTRINNETSSRPMALQEVDDEGNLWFLSAVDSEKNKEIEEGAKVELYFMNHSKYEYVFVAGEASVSQDKALIEKYYSAFANAWFEGKDDPNISVIKVIPSEGYYYETKDNKLIAMSRMLFAAITGKPVEDGGIEGELKLD